MLKNEKSANRNEHQNRKTAVFWHKNRKTDLKNSQNCKTENLNAPSTFKVDLSCFDISFSKCLTIALAKTLKDSVGFQTASCARQAFKRTQAEIIILL